MRDIFFTFECPATQETQEEEEMTIIVLVREQRRQRVREGRRLARNKLLIERYIWEKEEEEERPGPDAISDRFSRRTSLSDSTITDSELPTEGSEAATADTISEPHSLELQDRPHYRYSYTPWHYFGILIKLCLCEKFIGTFRK